MIAVDRLDAVAGDFRVREMSFELPEGRYGAIVGPTGAGKTLLLEAVVGLLPATFGRIWISGRDVSGDSPESRRLGYVPQDQALFPHMTVAENIAFGLEDVEGPARDGRVREISALMGIERLLDRRPRTLSGGEAQRVALARALAPRPRVLLLDEPLTGLDGSTHDEMVEVIRRVHGATGATILHVTHDLDEALSLASHLGVIHAGRLLQWGTTSEVVDRPGSAHVARATGYANLLPGVGMGAAATYGEFVFPGPPPSSADFLIAIRAEDILLGPVSLPNQACVERLLIRSRDVRVTLRKGASCVDASTSAAQARALGLEPGKEVGWDIEPDRVHFVPSESAGVRA